MENQKTRVGGRGRDGIGKSRFEYTIPLAPVHCILQKIQAILKNVIVTGYCYGVIDADSAQLIVVFKLEEVIHER
jgi:hypothetical protein